jgi:hypothetical protein
MLMRAGNPAGRRRSHRDDVEAETLDQTSHFVNDNAVFGNDQGFGHGSRRDHDFAFGFEDPDASISLRFAEDLRHQRIGSPAV